MFHFTILFDNDRFNHLGRLGRTGNQMFQYAALRGIAANAGVNYCIPYHQDIVDDGTWK